VPFWHRVLKTHSRPSDSASSDIPGGSGLSQLSNAKVSDFQPNRSVSVSSESIQPSSLSVAQQPISLPETSTCPKYVPNQLDWSVDFDGDVKPALKVKLEHVLTPGAVVGRVRFSPDGKYLAVGVNDGRTYIYDVKTWAKTWSVTFTWFGERQLTFVMAVTVFWQITLKQANEPFGVSVSPRMVDT